jgi:site-specific recombinase XerD
MPSRQQLSRLDAHARKAHRCRGKASTTRLDSTAIARQEYQNEAGIEDFHWHDSRHSFANSLIMAEVDMRTVAQLPAHKNASDGDAVPSAFAVPRTGGSRTVV